MSHCRPTERDAANSASLDEEVAQIRRMPVRTWFSFVRDDQVRRWRSGRGLAVEDYFARLPEILDNREDAIVLICGEIQLREELGEPAVLEEYTRRFPGFADELALQFEINQALDHPPVEPEGADQERATPPRLRGYGILREVGRGASSVVYLARQRSPERLVAIKALTGNIDSRQKARHLREAEILAKIRHANVIHIYEAVKQRGRLYLVMEYVDGPTLVEHTAGRALPPREAAALVATLAEAIHVVHAEGILHRDLKPANVLLSPGGVPIITDFGLARWLGNRNSASTENTLLGTPSYMSPEQAVGGDDAAAPTADVYSLGAILYELLTGHPCFAEATLLATLTAIREREVIAPRKLIPSISRELETIVLTALAKSPSERYLTAAALADDLRRFLADQPILAPRANWFQKSRRWCRHKPALAGLLVALAVVVVASFCGITWQWRNAVLARTEAEQYGRQAELRATELAAEKDRMQQALSLMEFARLNVSLLHWDDAMAAYSQAIDLRPEMSDAYEERGQHYLTLYLMEPAAADIQRAYEIRRPAYSTQWLRQALLRKHVDDDRGYQQVCREMLEQFGVSGHSLAILDVVRAGAAADDSGLEPDPMLTLAETVIEPFRNQKTLHILGLAQYRAGKYAQALTTCRESLAAEGDLPGLNYPVLAMAEFQLGQLDQARVSLQRATEAFDVWTDALYQTTDIHWTSHLGATTTWPIAHVDWLEFLLLYYEAQRLLGVVPREDPRLLVVRGRAYAALRRTDEAVDAYQQALSLSTNDSRIRLEAHRCRALGHILAREFRPAAEEYARAIELTPDDADLWRYHAISLLCARDLDRYRAACQQMLQQFAQSDSPLAGVAVVEVCVCRGDSLQDFRQLLPLAELASQYLPDSSRFLAAAQFRAGDFHEAVQTLSRLETYCRLRAVDLFVLAMAHHQLQEHDQARRRFHEAIAWIDEANQPSLPSLAHGNPARWGAWTERPETFSVQREAAERLGR